MADLSEPFRLSYEGGDAVEHRVDAALLGQSLQGSARLYNSVARFWFYGDVPKRLVPTIRVVAGPPQEGSLVYLIYLVMVHGQLAVFPSLLFEFADLAMPAIVKAIFARRAGRSAELDKALDILQGMSERADAFALTVHKDHVFEKQQLYETIGKLTDGNRTALSEIAKPVGPSVKQLTHFKNTDYEAVIDEPLAEVFKAKEELIVGDQVVYRAKLLAVDKAAGTCRVEIDGAEKLIRGKITDPSLKEAGNPYTHSLDADNFVMITAKPVLKNGEITTLYISNASEAA